MILSKKSKEFIDFLKKNDFFFKTNINIFFFDTLLKKLIEIYKQHEHLDCNLDEIPQQNKINLIYHNQIEKIKNNLPNTLNILNYIYQNENEKFNIILNQCYLEKDKINELLLLLKNINNPKQQEELIEWMNFYGKPITLYLNKKLQMNNHLLNEINNIDLYSYFISIDIQKDIELYFNCIYKYSLNYNGINIESTFITDNKSVNKYFVKSLFIRVLCWLKINNNNSIHFKSYLSSLDKKMPAQKYLDIGSKQVNTGSTYRGNCNKIVIWRIEEIKKVLIHEMGHCLKIEFGPPFIHHHQEINYNNLEKHIIFIFNIPIDTDIRLYETYNEIWALIANTMFCTVESLLNNTNHHTIQKTFIYFLQNEISFSLFQSAKIIKYFGFNDFNDFFSLKGFTIEKRNKTKYKQSSSILSYYIIKSALLFNINIFMEFCFRHNKDTNHIKFNEDSFKEFQILIDKCLSNTNYINTINKYLKKINKIKKNKLYDSLRMTIIDV